MTKQLLQCDLLDLLVDGPSSFAALYGALVRHWGYPAHTEISMVLEATRGLEAEGAVLSWQMAEDGRFHKPTEAEFADDLAAYQRWLPGAQFEELSLDEVGLWYELTEMGRERWRLECRRTEGPIEGRWTVDDEVEARTIVVQAKTAAVAEGVLQDWLSSHPKVLPVAKHIEFVPAFALRDGTVVSDGVKLVCEYDTRED